MSTDRLPKLCVLDLDMCVWSPETYTLRSIPSAGDVETGPLLAAGEGVRGVRCGGGEVLRIFDGALQVLQEVHDGKYPSMRLALASSADTPHATKIAHAALRLLEVKPSVTFYDVVHAGWDDDGSIQIGRSRPLSGDKAATHFPILRKNTGIDYPDMLFFDDSNWTDHCREVARRCPGVVTQATPDGMQYHEFQAGLRRFAEAAAAGAVGSGRDRRK